MSDAMTTISLDEIDAAFVGRWRCGVDGWNAGSGAVQVASRDLEDSVQMLVELAPTPFASLPWFSRIRERCREGLPTALRAGVGGKRRQDAESAAAIERGQGMRAPIRFSGLVVRSERPATGHGQPRPA